MKFISIPLISLLMANVAFAADVQITPTETGFQVKLSDDKVFLVSKSRYSSDKNAATFCSTQNLTLSKKGLELLKQAVAGTTDAKALKAMTFKMGGESGIWAWVGDDTNAIIVSFDGEVPYTQKYHIVNILKIAKDLNTPEAGKVPAVCE